MQVIEIATALFKAIAPQAVASLLTQVDALASAPLESDLLETSLDLWDAAIGTGDDVSVNKLRAMLQTVYASRVAIVLPPQTISDDVAWDTSALEPSLWALSDLLTDPAGSTAASEPTQLVQPNTTIGHSLLADGIYQSLRARLNLARSLTILVLFIGARQEDFSRSFERLPLLISRLISIGHGLSVLVQLCDCPGAVEASTDGSGDGDEGITVVEQMKQLRVGKAHGDTPEDSASLLHKIVALGLLSSHHEYPGAHVKTRTQPKSFATSIASAVASLGITDIGKQSVDASSSMPSTTGLLAYRLVIAGHPSAALQVLEAFPATAAAQYIVARAFLAIGDLQAQAADAFLDVLPALLSSSLSVADPANQEASNLLLVNILPSSVLAGSSEAHFLSGYYRHVSDLFEAIGADAQIALFTRLAVESLRKADPTSDALSDLYYRRFRSELALQRFSACYAIVMEMASVDTILRRDCLRTLVSAMCEADQVYLLLSYNFAGLQTEVERNLSFKARNCDPRALAGPNYYHILYSYHMRRGDFTSAGAVMYQQAHRLADAHQSVAGVRAVETYLELAVAQARSYLAAINALSLLASKDAWFANAVINKASDAEAAHHGSTPLSSFIPSQHWQPDSKELRIVRADDVRREYQLVLARLELVQLYPELASPTMTLSAADAVALFVRNDQYDKAFSTARALDVDESGIFSSIALKCAVTAHIETECMNLHKALLARTNPDGTESDGDAATQKLLADVNEVDSSTFVDTFKAVLSESDIATIASWSFLQASPRTASWTGSTSTLAWRYLKMNLDTSGSDPKYRLAVLHRLLLLTTSDGKRLDVPRWLITWFEENRPDLLIAAYMRGGLGSDAVRAALQWLRKSTKHLDGVTDVSTVGSVAAQQQFVPYLLLDGVLQMAEQLGDIKDSDAGALVAELKQELTRRRMGVLNGKWREARNWAEQKERRQNAATATTGAAGTMAADWD
jgi:nuclear pore complex protein Nup160